MKQTPKKAPKQVYDKTRKYFPLSCVDLLIFKNNSILLTKRTINPAKGSWHLPGSIILKGEKMEDTVARSAKEELNLNVKIQKYLGVYQNLDNFRNDISHGFIVRVKNGKLKTDFQSSELKFFKKIPKNTMSHHKKEIKDSYKLLKYSKN